MIDEAWLRGLQFDSPLGRVNGIIAVGGEAIIFRCTRPDGGDWPGKSATDIWALAWPSANCP